MSVSVPSLEQSLAGSVLSRLSATQRGQSEPWHGTKDKTRGRRLLTRSRQVFTSHQEVDNFHIKDMETGSQLRRREGGFRSREDRHMIPPGGAAALAQ